MCAAYKWMLFVWVMTWSSIVFANGASGSVPLLGNCDGHGECSVNLNASGHQWGDICDSLEFSAFWVRGEERYLVQCRNGGTSEENLIWVVDAKAGKFWELYFGRFFKRSLLELESNLKIQEKFGSLSLCRPAKISKLRVSYFVLLDKKPTNNEEDPYCYEPVYLMFRGGRLNIETNDGHFKHSDTDHVVHAVSDRDRARLRHLLDTVRKWHLQP
ncbi:conserved exported protein of unknown function [Burkholderia multivorans]